VILAAACGPLLAGTFFFGWRALEIAVLSVGGCMLAEAAYYRVTRMPALHGRSHAALTGLLLALTLPPTVPWYVPLAGAIIAILVGKALFGGVGHFLWQPALVGRVALAVLFAPPLLNVNLLAPKDADGHAAPAPVLTREHVVFGDVKVAAKPEAYRQWQGTVAPDAAPAVALPRPAETLLDLAPTSDDPPESIATTLRHMPPAWDLLCGAYGGSIGETSALVIMVAGLYLVYRNYTRGALPGMFLLGAALTAAIAPVKTVEGLRWAPLAGPLISPLLHSIEHAAAGGSAIAGRFWPLLANVSPALSIEGADVGFTYVAYHLLVGETMLAAWFMATEMTGRPVTPSGQAIFGLLCGVLTILLRLYVPALLVPAYAAVLICNTLTPVLDGLVRPGRFFRRARA
jgi:electron transport complex protein RnfD